METSRTASIVARVFALVCAGTLLLPSLGCSKHETIDKAEAQKLMAEAKEFEQ